MKVVFVAMRAFQSQPSLLQKQQSQHVSQFVVSRIRVLAELLEVAEQALGIERLRLRAIVRNDRDPVAQ